MVFLMVVLEELEVPKAFELVLEMALLNHQFLQCPQQCCKNKNYVNDICMID